MKARYLVAAAVAAISIGSVANATVQIRVTDTYVGGPTNIASTTASNGAGGSASVNSSDAFFQVIAGASGAPQNPDPNFSNFNFTVQVDGPLTVAHTLTIEFANTGLTAPISSYIITNSLNTLSAAGLTSASVVSYLGTNVAYDTSVATLNTLTCGAVASCASGPVTVAAAHPATYGETVKYTFTFGAGTTLNQSITGSNQIMAGSVPEPATWGMMVLGFGVVGGALRTSRRKVMFA